MIKYLVKSISKATEENKNFAGKVSTYYHGKGDYLVSTDNELIWNAPKSLSPYFVSEYGYDRLCDAKRCWSYKNPENDKFWKTTCSIVKVEVSATDVQEID